MGSEVWTDEESDHIKAMMDWKESLDSLDSAGLGSPPKTILRTPIGEFRILMVGAKGVGKTSIVSKFCTGVLPRTPDPFFEHGCRHPVELDELVYTADVLELPTEHLFSVQLFEQALAVTEAAVLVYAIDDPVSFRLCINLAEFIHASMSASARAYRLLLLGNKCDIDEKDRRVRWIEGSRAAAAVTSGFDWPRSRIGRAVTGGGNNVKCSFIEASADSGENIEVIFPLLGREALKLRWINQQRREQAERRLRIKTSIAQRVAATPTSVNRRDGLWKTLTTPFLKR